MLSLARRVYYGIEVGWVTTSFRTSRMGARVRPLESCPQSSSACNPSSDSVSSELAQEGVDSRTCEVLGLG